MALQVRTASGRSAFHIGEDIALVATFTTTASDKYRLVPEWPGGKDRSLGTSVLERVQIQPLIGWHDPLANLLITDTCNCNSNAAVEMRPGGVYTVNVDLNEWARFDSPGSYEVRIRAKSRVVFYVGVQEQVAEPVSAPLAITILPADPGRQASALRGARAVLSGGAATTSSAATMDALRTLGALGSAASARTLADAFDGSDRDETTMIELLSTPPAAALAALPELERRLENPRQAVSVQFLVTLTALRAGMPGSAPWPGTLGAPPLLYSTAALDALYRSLPAKTGRAQAISLYTAIAPYYHPHPALPADKVGALAGMVPAALGFLSPLQQSLLFSSVHTTPQLASPALVPVLQRIVSGMDADWARLPVPGGYDAAVTPSLQRDGAALALWIKLDPAGARATALAEISSPRPRYGANVLGGLPDATLAQLDQAMLHALLEQTTTPAGDFYRANAASLLARYAGPEIAGQVAKAEVGNAAGWNCEAQHSVFEYLTRVNAVPTVSGPVNPCFRGPAPLPEPPR